MAYYPHTNDLQKKQKVELIAIYQKARTELLNPNEEEKMHSLALKVKNCPPWKFYKDKISKEQYHTEYGQLFENWELENPTTEAVIEEEEPPEEIETFELQLRAEKAKNQIEKVEIQAPEAEIEAQIITAEKPPAPPIVEPKRIPEKVKIEPKLTPEEKKKKQFERLFEYRFNKGLSKTRSEMIFQMTEYIAKNQRWYSEFKNPF